MGDGPPRFLATVHLTPPLGGDPVGVDAVWAGFSPRGLAPGQRYCAAGEPVWADPPDASGPIVNAVRGKILFILRGNVDWITKAEHAEEAGAAGVIFVNSEDALDPMPVSGGNEQARIPCVMVGKNALSDKRLTHKNFGRGAVPGHANPDGPSFCTITCATMGEAGFIDVRSLVDGLDGHFADPDFPPNDHSLYVDPDEPMPAFNGRQIIWKWPEELVKYPQLFVDDENEVGDGAEANDIIQGSLGDCFLLSSAAILASAKGQDLIKKLFSCSGKFFAKGLLCIRFFKKGRWMDIVIDALVPCLEGRTPSFVRMKDPTEFWMIFLEKAYAKLHGCYEALDGGFMNESLVDMTGAAPGRVKVLDLFAACTSRGKVDKDRAMRLLKSHAHGMLLQGASSDAGGSEEALGHGLYSGHAYAITDCRMTSSGEALVQLRNPWGGHEWTGAWNDKDPRWTDALKRELNHTDRDDGMFWMSIDDFAKNFTEITFVDMVPDTFTVLRAEGAWTAETAGGCANHTTWKDNPQLLLKVTKPTHLTISLNQPDTRMEAKKMGKAAFDKLYRDGAGYDEYIGFAVFQGGARRARYASRDILASADYTCVRTVSTTISDLQPGEYIIVPTTFDPKQMKFHMRFWANNKIKLVDTMGGRDFSIFDASGDGLNKSAGVPLSGSEGQIVPVEQSSPEQNSPGSPTSPNDIIRKYSRNEAAVMSDLLPGITDGLKKAIWKIGEMIPKSWGHGIDFLMAPQNTFQVGETAVIMRSDRSIRFCKVSEVLRGDTYEVIIGRTAHGPLYKTGVPSQYLGKLEQQGGYPTALLEQVGLLFDMLDTDGSGSLEVKWNSNELSSDIGKRLLMEMGVDPTNMVETYQAMKALDANGDGKVDRVEFVNWMAARSLERA